MKSKKIIWVALGAIFLMSSGHIMAMQSLRNFFFGSTVRARQEGVELDGSPQVIGARRQEVVLDDSREVIFENMLEDQLRDAPLFSDSKFFDYYVGYIDFMNPPQDSSLVQFRAPEVQKELYKKYYPQIVQQLEQRIEHVLEKKMISLGNHSDKNSWQCKPFQDYIPELADEILAKFIEKAIQKKEVETLKLLTNEAYFRNEAEALVKEKSDDLQKIVQDTHAHESKRLAATMILEERKKTVQNHQANFSEQKLLERQLHTNKLKKALDQTALEVVQNQMKERINPEDARNDGNEAGLLADKQAPDQGLEGKNQESKQEMKDPMDAQLLKPALPKKLPEFSHQINDSSLQKQAAQELRAKQLGDNNAGVSPRSLAAGIVPPGLASIGVVCLLAIDVVICYMKIKKNKKMQLLKNTQGVV